MEQLILKIRDIPFDTRFYILVFGQLLILLFIVINFFCVKYRKNDGLSFKPFKELTYPGYVVSIVITVFSIFIAIFLVLFNTASIYIYSNYQPKVIKTEPRLGGTLSSENESITIHFDSPINYENLRPNISPETKGKWTCNYIKYTNLCTSITFKPSESYEPDHRIIIYFVDITNTTETTKEYDESMAFDSPKIPKILSSSPFNGEAHAGITNRLTLNLSDPTGDFVDWKIENNGGFNTELIQKDRKIELELDKNFELDTEYTFDIYQTLKRYDLNSHEEIFRGDTNKVYSLTFTTASSPSLKSYSPKGSGVLTDVPIEIVFNDPMIKETVEPNLKVEPEIKSELSWTDDNHLVIKPLEELKKETTYKVTLMPGIKSKYNVVTNKEVNFSFTTIGKVTVKSVSPINGGTGYGINNNITIEFNQKVDKASAQAHFSLSPTVSGSFNWSGNKMTYQVSNKLKYSTAYTIRLSSGIKSIYGLDSDKSYKYTFTTKNQLTTISVPWYSQDYSGGYFDCNIVAARMALGARGVYVSSGSVKSALGTGSNPNVNYVDGYGVHWSPISAYISKYRKNTIKTGWNTAALAAEVEKGNPVILWWWNRYHTQGIIPDYSPARYRGMHSEVVVGFVGSSSNPTSIITNDPWRGRLTYTRALFESTWGYLGRTAIVVY